MFVSRDSIGVGQKDPAEAYEEYRRAQEAREAAKQAGSK